MRISDQMIATSLTARLSRASVRLFRFQEQVASGLAFTRPSENPAGSVRAATLRGNISEVAQYQANCDQARTWLRLTEIALSDIGQSLRSAREAGLAMSAFDEEGNTALAEQVGALAQRIVSIANSTSEGRYLLAGHEILTPPVVPNPEEGAPYLYQGDVGEVAIRLSRSVRLAVNANAAQALNLGGAADPSIPDALATLSGIEGGLRTGDRSAVEDGLRALEDHIGCVLALRAQIGSRMEQVELAATRLADGALTLRDLLSGVEDVDLGEALIGLRSQEVAYQAAAAAAAALQRASLLDYL